MKKNHTMKKFYSKDYKPLEKIIEEKKIKTISLVIDDYSDDGVDMTVYGDGKPLYMIDLDKWKGHEFFNLKLKKKRSLSLAELEINVFGFVKAKFRK